MRQFVSDIQQCKILTKRWTTVWFWIIHYDTTFLQIRYVFFKTSKRICSIEPLWGKPFQLSVVLAIKKMQQKNMNLKIHRSAFILQPIFKRLYQDAEHFQIDLFCQEKRFMFYIFPFLRAASYNSIKSFQLGLHNLLKSTLRIFSRNIKYIFLPIQYKYMEKT